MTGDEHRHMLLMVTRACQLDCVYCGFDRARPAMSAETMRASVDLLMTARAEEVKLQFFGGEPLLRPDFLFDSMDYAEAAAARAGKSVRFYVTTNLFALDDALRARFDARGVSWILSLDGGARTQAAQRPAHGRAGDYAKALEQVSRTAASGAPYRVNMTVCAAQAGDVAANAGSLVEAGVRSLSIYYRLGELWTRPRASAYFRSLRSFLEDAHARGVFVLNSVAQDEPVLASPAPTVDCDGQVYVSCVVPALEKLLPEIVSPLRQGRVGEISGFDAIRVTREEVSRRVVRAARGRSRALVANNMAMGRLNAAFFRRMAQAGLVRTREETPLDDSARWRDFA